MVQQGSLRPRDYIPIWVCRSTKYLTCFFSRRPAMVLAKELTLCRAGTVSSVCIAVIQEDMTASCAPACKHSALALPAQPHCQRSAATRLKLRVQAHRGVEL